MAESRRPVARPGCCRRRPAAFLLAALLTLTTLSDAQAQRPAAGARGAGADLPHLEARVDSLFAEWDRPGSPGAAVAVLKDGVVVLERGYGSAQLEHGVPITPQTVFHVASVTKQFTAFAVAMLADRGRLSLDDDVRTHIPELPDPGPRVTLRHLIHHTSGIRDQWELLAMGGWRLDDVITKDHILAMAVRQRELNFEPGAEHLYSNMGYTLLAEVVERVGGAPFPEWMRENVFDPLGMRSTHMHDDHEMVVPGRAYSYAPVRDSRSAGGSSEAAAGPSWRNAVLSYANAGATSLFTTAGDLARWLRNFETAEVGGPAVVDQMRERAVLTRGDTIAYAFAIARGEHRGRTTWSHGGADAGFRSNALYIPEERLGVVVLSNAATFDAGSMARRVADVVMRVEEDVPARVAGRPVADTAAAVMVPRRLLEAYAGRWDIDGIGPVRFQRRGDRLAIVLGQPRPMEARSDSTFLFDGAVIRFIRTVDGVDSLEVRTDGRELAGRRIDPAPLDADALADYAGVYYSAEVETLYRVGVRGDSLVLSHIRHGDVPLEQIDDDVFTGGRWPFTRLAFERDGAGAVEGFRLTGGRVRNLRFVRLSEGALR